MFRSSIFSSDTLDLRGLRPYGCLLAIVILVVVELLVVRSDFAWSFAENSQPGIVDALESQVIEKSTDPKVVVLGNSRVRDAIIPRDLSQNLGLEHGSVLNLSLTAGDPFDSLTLYRRNRQVLSRADWLVVGIDNVTDKHRREPSERYRRFAAPSERWSDYKGDKRRGLLVGLVWQSYDANKSLGRLLKANLLRQDRSVAIAEDGRVQWRNPNVGVVDDSLERAESFYGRPNTAHHLVHYVRDLLDLAHADGVRVVLYRPPLNPKFVGYRDELAPKAESEFEEYVGEVREHPSVAAELTNSTRQPSQFREADFWDYGHMQPLGAKRTTAQLAETIRQASVD